MVNGYGSDSSKIPNTSNQPSHHMTSEEKKKTQTEKNEALIQSGDSNPAFKVLSKEQSDSAWAKMFPGGATKEEFTKFLNNFLNMMIHEFKKDTEKWHKAQEMLKRVAEGKDPYE